MNHWRIIFFLEFLLVLWQSYFSLIFCSRRASEASEETTLYFRSIFPLLLSHKLYFCSTKVQKVGKLVGNYFCSTKVQKVCKPVGFYFCSTTVKLVGKLVGTYFCCTAYYGSTDFTAAVLRCNTSSSTTVYGPLLRFSGRTPLLRFSNKIAQNGLNWINNIFGQ